MDEVFLNRSTGVRATYRRFLTWYPTIASSPLDVSIHFFSTSDYEWNKDGDLASPFKPSKVDFSPQKSDIQSELSDIQYEAAMLKYNFIIDNMKRIVRLPVDSSIFATIERRTDHSLLNLSNYATAFNYPANISSDWGEALLRFLKWWKYNFRLVNGVGLDQGTERDHWPRTHNEYYDLIDKTHNELFELVRGVSWEVHEEETMKLVTEIMNEIMP